MKQLPEGGELYVFAENAERIAKERSMRFGANRFDFDYELLMKLGSARSKVPGARRLVEVDVDEHGAVFTYRLNRKKLEQIRRREGRYLLRTNLPETDPVKLCRPFGVDPWRINHLPSVHPANPRSSARARP